MRHYEDLKPIERAAVDTAINHATRVLVDLNVRITQDGLKLAREALARAVHEARPAVDSHSLF